MTENKSKEKYKLETWNRVKWKGTKREQKTTTEKLVKRDSNGRFAKNSPVITEIRIKTYASGTYQVGYKNGKAITRYKIKGQKTEEWYNQRKNIMKNAQIYRCSLALNDIPISSNTHYGISGNEYYGFRIVAYSRNKSLLHKVYPQKMYKKLIEFIEKCVKYRSGNFWFDHYLNYMGKIAPELSNTSPKDSGKYELLWTQRKTGRILKQEFGEIYRL